MKLEYRDAVFNLSSEQDVEGFIEGHASIWDKVDSHNTRFIRGAFKESLQHDSVHFLWNHESGGHKPFTPIGKIVEIREDDKGLFIRAKILQDVEKGREALALAKAGIVDSFSFGFSSTDYEYGKDGIREYKGVNIHEVSMVGFPSQPDAKITSARNEDIAIDDSRMSTDFVGNLSESDITQKISSMPLVLQDTLMAVWMNESTDVEKLNAFKKALADFGRVYLESAKAYIKAYGEGKRSIPSQNTMEIALYEICQERKITLPELAQDSQFSINELRAIASGKMINSPERIKTLSVDLFERYTTERSKRIDEFACTMTAVETTAFINERAVIERIETNMDTDDFIDRMKSVFKMPEHGRYTTTTVTP